MTVFDLRRWLGAALPGVTLLASCATARSGGTGADACRAVEGRLPASASTAEMAGDFSFTMVATVGAQAGQSVTGRLSLQPQDSALVPVERASQPLRGTAEVALEQVGAVRMGDLGATDPAAPGVAVYEQRAPGTGTPTVVVRLGSFSNGRGPDAFDAGHTTLYVRRISREGFRGGWASTSGARYPRREAQGFFCAERAGP